MKARIERERARWRSTVVDKPVASLEFEAVYVITLLRIQAFSHYSSVCICFGAQALSGSN